MIEGQNKYCMDVLNKMDNHDTSCRIKMTMALRPQFVLNIPS